QHHDSTAPPEPETGVLDQFLPPTGHHTHRQNGRRARGDYCQPPPTENVTADRRPNGRIGPPRRDQFYPVDWPSSLVVQVHGPPPDLERRGPRLRTGIRRYEWIHDRHDERCEVHRGREDHGNQATAVVHARPRKSSGSR